MRRFEIQTGMHMGPLKRQINRGDVISWDLPTRTMTLNGNRIAEAKGMDLKEAVSILERQILKNPDQPWAKELKPVNVSMGELEINTGTQVVLPILGCLQSAEEFLAKNEGWEKTKRQVNWTPANEDQYQFLKRFLAAKAVVNALGKNLRRKADRSVDVINAWLKENGFDIQLSPELDPRTFAVASILDVLVEWVQEGKITSIYNAKGTFPAVTLKSGDEDNMVKFLDRNLHPFPIAGIRTKSGDLVRMSVLDFMPSDTFAISDKVEQLRNVTIRERMGHCDGVIFPMIDYNRMVDIGWIKGMQTGPQDDDYYIGQALQQTKFRMNEKGARAESAVAMKLFKHSATEDNWIHIDKPFIMWIERPGISVPLFAGVFAEDVWKKPAGL